MEAHRGPVKDQPPPQKSDERPIWESIIEFIEENSPHLWNLIPDMRERDRLGRERYGVPLTANNGRDHLVDALQELLDGVAYLSCGHANEKEMMPATLIAIVITDLLRCASIVRVLIDAKGIVNE